MKVLGIVCSPRIGGNTEILVNEALASAKASGAEVELITLAQKNISFCDGCLVCEKTAKCKIKDDMKEIYSKLLEADGIIFGTPVYFWSVSAQAKALIDRTYAFKMRRGLRNKVVGTVVVARRSGATQAINVFHSFFAIQRMILAAGVAAHPSDEEIARSDRGGVAIAYVGETGDVRKDERGMVEARNVGKAVARTIREYKEKNLI